MESLKERLTAEIVKLTTGTHFHLMDLKISRARSFTGLQVFIDRDDGYFSHDDCRNWSQLIMDMVDRKEMIVRDYRLEVSSPGVGRNLQERWEYEKNLEKKLWVAYFNAENEVEEITGDLVSVTDEGIGLLKGKSELTIKWAQIERASVKTPW